MNLSMKRVGLVDGSIRSSTRRFDVVLEADAVVQLDDLVVVTQTLPDDRVLNHYGIVVEGMGRIEGAEMSSDTARISGDHTMPGITSRCVTVQVLRTHEELWIPPAPGSHVHLADGEQREMALFADQMSRPLPVGLDQHERPIYLDFSFLNGEKGGHASISGISGVATKTSFALFLLYMLFETPHGDTVLGHHKPNTHAIVFNVKGEDLLHLDRANRIFDDEKRRRWASLGVPNPGVFRDVEFFVPRARNAMDGARVGDVESRNQKDVTIYGWTPWDFVRGGLLRFCFADANDRNNQLSFIEQKVRAQLVRWAHKCSTGDGSIVLADPGADFPKTFEKALQRTKRTLNPGEGVHVEDFGDLVDFLDTAIGGGGNPDWDGGVQVGTVLAFLRRLYAVSQRLGQLVSTNVTRVELRRSVSVVDIHSLHDDAQRFVVGALLFEIFDAKQGTGREPLQFIVLDELNKYAPREGSSPIKDVLVDIAARGRSLGVILIGAQQSAADVEKALTTNAAVKIVGRLDAGNADDYRFLSPELQDRASRFLPGTMIIDQPIVPAPIPFRYPFAAYATNVNEASGSDDPADVDALFASL